MHNYMKNYIFFVLFSFIFVSLNSSSQEINEELLKNLSPAQASILKNQISKNGISSSNPKPIVTESTKKISNTQEINPGIKKYGYNYFSSAPTSIAAVGDLPLPNEYKISLKDQFTVILSGSIEKIFDLDVQLDGTILFPEIGSISVVGETFIDVKKKLKNLIDQTYIGVSIDLSIKNLAAKKITIVGAVNNPGTYLVNPFSTISSSLNYSGGISKIGTLRDIKLIRNNGEIFLFDLYKLLINGDRSQDVTIEAGDVILIEPANQFIAITGSINRPAIYEIKKNETLDDLISYALGFTNIANKTNINLTVLDNKSSSIFNKTTNDIYFDLKNVLSVNVYPYLNKNKSNIQVSGAVKEPGFYSLENYKTLQILVESLEFIDVYPWMAVIEQFDENNLIKSSTLFSLVDKSTYQDIELLPNSKIFFLNRDELTYQVNDLTETLIKEFELSLNLRGDTYSLPVYGKYRVKSLLDFLGLDMQDIDEVASYISPLEGIVLNESYMNMEFNSKKYHTISFRSPVNDLIRVSISGSIEYPGIYTLTPETKLQDLYKLIGKFKSEAFLDGIVFTRDSVRNRQLASIEKSKEDLNKAILASVQRGDNIGDINVITALSTVIEPANLGRIAGDFKPDSLSALNTVLLDGDSIFIPKNPNIISVLGEVLNPTAFEYKNRMSIRTAIEKAGGYQDFADKRKVYVIKANGIIERANKSLFVKNVKLEPGDTIIVPRKIIKNNPGIDALLPLTQILSDFAFSAAAIETLSNNN